MAKATIRGGAPTIQQQSQFDTAQAVSAVNQAASNIATPTGVAPKTTPTVPDALHDKTKPPVNPPNGNYVWIDTPAGGVWSLHQNTPTTGGSNGQVPSGGNGNTPSAGPTVTNTFTDNNGHTIAIFSDGSHKDMGLSQEGAATSTTRQNAFDLLKDQFTQFGVLKKDASGNYDSASQGLLNTVKSLIMGGAGPDTASLTLQQSPAYQERFKGNIARQKAGLRVLSPAEYIATENSYDQVLKAAGFPAGYSNPDKWAQFISNDMSPAELSDRVATAAKSIANKDPFYTQTLQNYYGLTQGDMLAHALDPQAALPLLQRQQAATNFGAAAARQGLNVASNTAEQYAALGITQQQAEQGFQNIGAELPNEQKLAAIYDGQFGTPADQQKLLQSATFGGTNAAQAQLQLQKLKQQETNAFSGSAGVAKGSLQGDQSGTF